MVKRDRSMAAKAARANQPDPRRTQELIVALLEGNTSRQVRRQQARMQKKLDSYKLGS